MNNTFEYETDNDITVIPKQILRAGLSAKAVGLYTCIVYLLNRDERISTSKLAEMGNEGLASIENGLKELESAGYLIRTKKKDSKGRFCTVYQLKDN